MNKFQILSTKTNIQLKKLELFWIKKNKIRNLFSILVIIFVSLFVVATKYEKTVNAAGLSNMVIAQGMDYAKCQEQGASKPWSKWIAYSGPTFDTKEFDNLTSIGDIAINWFTIPCKDTIVVPENEIDDFLEAYYPTFYIPNYASYDRTSSGDFVITDINGSSTIGFMGNTMASLYQNKPVSTEYFANQTLAKINPVKYTDAAAILPKFVTSTGAEILQATSKASSLTVSIAISIVIIIIIIDALAILFRKKINPGALISLLNGIPSLIVAILLIIFSYPISALILDSGNLLTSGLQSYVFNQVKLNVPAGGLLIQYSDSKSNSVTVNIPDVYNGMSIGQIYDGQTYVSLSKEIDDYFQYLSANSLNVFNVFGVGNIGGKIDTLFTSNSAGSIEISPIQLGNTELTGVLVQMLNNMLSGFTGDKTTKTTPPSQSNPGTMPAGVSGSTTTQAPSTSNTINFSANSPGGLIAFILAAVAFFTMFKIFFALIKSFVYILFLPVLAPLYFISSALPGQNKLITKWFKSLLASVLTFPIFYAASILIVFLGAGFISSTSNLNWFPTGLGITGNTGSSTINLVYSLAAYGIYLMLPNLPKMIESALGSTGSSFDKYGSSAIGQTRSVLRKIPIVNMVPGI
ncbi:hypothetical protein IPJ91_01390 [bacterium]|nr:MAG: hypothetical protein IPJ91_01390 [bacterium]